MRRAEDVGLSPKPEVDALLLCFKRRLNESLGTGRCLACASMKRWHCPFPSGGFSHPSHSKAKTPTGDWIGGCVVMSSARCENPGHAHMPRAMLDELLKPPGGMQTPPPLPIQSEQGWRVKGEEPSTEWPAHNQGRQCRSGPETANK